LSDTSSKEGLTVIYDDESLTFTFDWDPETHPEYNFLSGMTSSELVKMLTDYLELLTDEEKDSAQAALQVRGQGGGEAESIDDPEPQA
jgi:hypothetical protein